MVLPSAKQARYAGSSRRIGITDSRSASTARNASAIRSGMVSTVGPVSKLKPSRVSTPARPPGCCSRSSTVTSCP